MAPSGLVGLIADGPSPSPPPPPSVPFWAAAAAAAAYVRSAALTFPLGLWRRRRQQIRLSRSLARSSA